MSEGGPRVVLLVGSPKGLEKSASARLGGAVVSGLEERGWTSESIHLNAAVASDLGRRELVETVDRADVVLFASPLYVDSLPAPAIRALELIAANRRVGRTDRVPRFVPMINCGFVEASQNDTCLRILQRFADGAAFEWLAGISLGGGGALTQRVRKAFDLLVEAIDLELLAPVEVDRLTRKPIMPKWLYVLGGNAMWRREAAKNGVRDRLRDRPYQRSAA